MGFWSSVGSFVSGAISVVSSAIGSIGSAIGSVAGSLLKVASPYIGTIIQIVDIVSKVLGILKPDEKPEIIGDKALNADKTVEDFDTTQEYIEYLRNDVEFDKEKFEELSDEEKLARKAIGTSISMKAINEHKGFEVSIDTWTTLAKLHKEGMLSTDNMDSFLDKFKEDQPELNSYVKDELKGSEEIELSSKLAEAYQKLEPELSIDEINDKVLKTKIGD